MAKPGLPLRPRVLGAVVLSVVVLALVALHNWMRERQPPAQHGDRGKEEDDGQARGLFGRRAESGGAQQIHLANLGISLQRLAYEQSHHRIHRRSPDQDGWFTAASSPMA